MLARADISLYPLADDFIPPIDDVIERLNAHAAIDVVTNPMSTQVTGEYDVLMAALTEEIRVSFERHGKCVFVFKLLAL
ncbi:MAG: hypothetical protein AAF270_08310 [Pseudomonadota bacterium]